MYYQEYLLKISGQSDHPLQSTGPKSVSLSAHALVSVTFRSMTSPVTVTTFSRLPVEWREIFDLRDCNSAMGGLIDLKFAGSILGSAGILARG